MAVEKKEVVDFYHKYFGISSPSRRKLTVHVWGGNALEEKSAKDVEALEDLTSIDDLSAFKAKSEVY